MAAAGEGAKDASAIAHAQAARCSTRCRSPTPRTSEDARRGFLGSLPEVEIQNDAGTRRVDAFATTPSSAEADAPPTVNPSLWRQARLNMSNGLFRVDGPHLPGARLRHLEHDR